jgi:hypothetical protein
VLDES